MSKVWLVARGPSAALALSLAIGCQGDILGSGSMPPADGSGLVDASPGAPDPTLSSGPSDDELRAKDPELFETALRYFPGTTMRPGKKRLFRLTRQQLDLTTQSLLPRQYGPSALAALPRDPLQTNYEYADNLSFNAANFTPLTQWVDQLATAAKADQSGVVDCAAQQDSPACLDAAARSFVSRAFRGVVSDSTLERFARFFTSSVVETGLAQATADLVSLTLTSPGYVFREEVTTNAEGVLLPAQLLQNLTYTLTDSPPEALGLTAAPELDGAAAARQILATPLARAKLQRFFSAWLELKEPQDFDISAGVYPEFTPQVAAAVVEDARRFLARQLESAVPTLRELTEETSVPVSPASAFLYGVAAPSGDDRAALSPRERLGIFSHPALIASHSGPTTTRLVKRGVFFTRKVMCLPLGVPPPDVDTMLQDAAMGTEREHIEGVTAPPRCMACHAFINPFGFMQESYDAIGRFRTTDAGKPIDPSVAVDFLDEGPFQAATSVDALRGFTRSLRFQQCFTRQLFRFYLGRDETPDDDPLLRQLFFELAGPGGQSIVGVLQGLAGASTFGRRAEAP